MKNYAYLDKFDVLHVTTDEKTAKLFSKNERYQETELASDHGYPVEKGERLVVYRLDEAYIQGNAGDGIRVSLNNYPKTLALYKGLA